MRYLLPGSILIILFVSVSSFAQEFAIKKIELTPESIILHYDLIDTVKTHTYTISLFASTNNFTTGIKNVKGDVGLEVHPGANRKIIWNSREELGSTFKGDIEMEIKGRVYIPFIKFDGFQDEQIIKRKKPKTITWSGGTTRNLLNFSLYKKGKQDDDEFIEVFPNIPNTGTYDIVLPGSVKTGKGYYFVISDAKNKDQAVKTQSFRVKPKVPFIVKILPVAAIGAVTYMLLPKSTAENIEGPPELPSSSN